MDGGPKLPFGLDLDRGQGLLGARALWAGVVGPSRLAMAKGSSLQLGRDRPTEIAKNLGAADAVMFVGVSLAMPDDTQTAVQFQQAGALFGGDNQLGRNASMPTILLPSMPGYQFAFGFTQILMPGEQLYGQLSGGNNLGPLGASVDTARVVVKQVQF
jgi:hypothetical protein